MRLIQRREIEFLLLGVFLELPHRPGFDLPDPLFGHAELLSDLLERVRLRAISESVTVDDNLTLTIVEFFEDSLDGRSDPRLRLFDLRFDRPSVRPQLEREFLTG